MNIDEEDEHEMYERSNESVNRDCSKDRYSKVQESFLGGLEN